MSTKNIKSSSHNTSGTSSSSKSSSKAAVNNSQVETEQTTGIINIPILRSKDNAKQLPIYHAALQRSSDDCLAAENLDGIQLELEKMLSNVALRYRVLKAEYDNLDRDEKRNERRLKHASNIEKAPNSPAAGNSSNGKRKRDENSSSSTRKSKHASSTSQKHSKYSKGSSGPQQQNEDSNEFTNTTTPVTATTGRDIHQPKLTLPKNDMPNKFWLSVEPFCMPLTNEDLRLIDELLEQYDGPLVAAIPELGPHYSDVWAQEQLKEMQHASSGSVGRVKSNNNEANGLLKRADMLNGECVTGPLTQRLVSALIEEQLQPHGSIEQSAGVEDETGKCKMEKSSGNMRSLSLLRNCVGIEQRIKKELVEQGILDANDLSVNGDEDEILSEIKRLMAELKTVAEYNGTALKRLRESAIEEIKRTEIKRKLDIVDQDIMETYKRSMQSKAKRKPLTTEEQQEIFRLTAEQKTLSNQLENSEAKTILYD